MAIESISRPYHGAVRELKINRLGFNPIYALSGGQIYRTKQNVEYGN